MLRSMKALLEQWESNLAFHDALLVIDSLGGLVMDLTEVFSFMGFLLGARFVERLESVSCAGASAWSFSPA